MLLLLLLPFLFCACFRLLLSFCNVPIRTLYMYYFALSVCECAAYTVWELAICTQCIKLICFVPIQYVMFRKHISCLFAARLFILATPKLSFYYIFLRLYFPIAFFRRSRFHCVYVWVFVSLAESWYFSFNFNMIFRRVYLCRRRCRCRRPRRYSLSRNVISNWVWYLYT